MFGDILFPGMGMSVGESHLPMLSITRIIVTSMVYGCYAMIFKATYAYPLWIGTDILRAILILLALYNIWFLIASIRRFARRKRWLGI